MPTDRSDLPKTKTCSRCLKRKKLELFGKNARMKLGRKSYCLVCSAELQREWNMEQRKKAPGKKVTRKRGAKKAARRKAASA